MTALTEDVRQVSWDFITQDETCLRFLKAVRGSGDLTLRRILVSGDKKMGAQLRSTKRYADGYASTVVILDPEMLHYNPGLAAQNAVFEARRAIARLTEAD